MLYFLEAGRDALDGEWVDRTKPTGSRATYNKLANSSIAVVTPNESAIIAQTLEKAVFFQSEFGIRAGLPRHTCRWTQPTNDGNAMATMQTNAMLSAFRILCTSVLRMLHAHESVLLL